MHLSPTWRTSVWEYGAQYRTAQSHSLPYLSLEKCRKTCPCLVLFYRQIEIWPPLSAEQAGDLYSVQDNVSVINIIMCNCINESLTIAPVHICDTCGSKYQSGMILFGDLLELSIDITESMNAICPIVLFRNLMTRIVTKCQFGGLFYCLPWRIVYY